MDPPSGVIVPRSSRYGAAEKLSAIAANTPLPPLTASEIGSARAARGPSSVAHPSPHRIASFRIHPPAAAIGGWSAQDRRSNVRERSAARDSPPSAARRRTAPSRPAPEYEPLRSRRPST